MMTAQQGASAERELKFVADRKTFDWPRDHRAGMGGGSAAEAVMAEARSRDCDQES
jgi:hypothetical protein